ncbi:hybrid sensor histidine kinase/response regulator [Solimonas terrae]|uniref:Chemotaxis protein CheA n=1 Tax=Solimonas terrae TaxID=1396819 RepID=A0A6M2BQT6_9GAMM|nr:Hpt domain-containing protein [Solimonas terrae]NGY04571.1 response regulator [Solimonas terrae]
MNARLKPASVNGLHWVRGELDQSVTRARSLIELHLDNPDDALPLQQAYVELHQVRGTAAMIRCFGASMLAGEMTAGLHDLLQKRARETEVLFTALLGGTVQLTDYLQALSEEMPDCVLVLQPAINELRLARGQAVLTEAELFTMQMQALGAMLPLPEDAVSDARAAQAQAQRYLSAFQVSLLSWIRSAPDAKLAETRIGKISEQLAQQATRAETHQLWRSAAASIEALLGRTLENSLELKRLFGRVGQQIKQIADHGEDAGAAGSYELSLQLLFFVGRSRGRGARVQALRKHFQLAACLPDAVELDARRRRIHGPSTSLLAKVSDEIRADFTRIKDQIDLVVRAGGSSTDGFAEARKSLQRIADVLGALGLRVLQQTVVHQAQSLEGLGSETPLPQWLALAESILRVESSLEDALFRQFQPADGHSELNDETPTPRDLSEGVNALYRESLVNLARVKQSVDSFLKTGAGNELPNAALLIDEVASGLQILRSEQVADSARRLQRFVASAEFPRLRGNTVLAERFADTVAVLEYYIEAARDQSPLTEVLPAQIEASLDEIDRLLFGDRDASDRADMAPMAGAGEEAASEPSAPPSGEAAETVAAPLVDTAPAGDDDEIREIFLEEAGEVLATLRDNLPPWTRDPRERERLATLRRAFHTLKGSGRTVGAKALGEFSWAIESLLNRCLDGSVATSSGIVAVVNDAVALLPALIEAFRDKREADSAVEAVAHRAREYAEGRNPDAAPEPDMATVFREDAREKLAEVREWLAKLDHDMSRHVIDADAVRAFHTLRGSARLVDAPAVSELATALEQWLERLKNADGRLDDAGLSLIEAATETLGNWCEQVGSDAVGQQNARLWLEQIESLQGSVDRLHEDDEARQLAEIFAAEAFDLVQKAEGLLKVWAQSRDDLATRQELKVVFHTLTGAALMAECPAIGHVARALQKRIEQCNADAIVPSPAAFTELDAFCEAIYQQLDDYRDGKLGSESPELLARIAALRWDEGEATPVATPPDEPAASLVPEVVESLSVAAEPDAIEMPPVADSEGAADDAIDDPFSTEVLGAPVPVPAALYAMSEQGVDPELLNIFIAEAEELLESFDHCNSALEQDARDGRALGELRRVLHTLKGSARVAGVESIGDVAHALESLLDRAGADPQLVAGRLQLAADGLHYALDDLKRGHLPDLRALLAEFEATPNGSASPAFGGPEVGAEAADNADDETIELSGDGGAPVFEAETAPTLDEPAFAFFQEHEAAPADELPAVEPVPDAPAVADAVVAIAVDPENAASRTDGERPHAGPAYAPARESATLDADLMQIFGGEATELLEQLEQAYARWQVAPTQAGPAQEMQRALHTLKGGARMTGLFAMGDAAHELETRLAALEASGALQADALAPVGEAVAGLRRMTDRLERGDFSGLLHADDVGPQPAPPAPVPTGLWDPELFWRPDEDSEREIGLKRETARVPVEALDRMLNEAGEISIYRSRLEEHNSGIEAQLAEMAQAVTRVREQLRQLDIETDAQIAARGLTQADNADRYAGEFDPLEMDRYTRMQELSRALAESVGDLSALHTAMETYAIGAETLLQQQGRINTEVQQGLMRTLMVPFSRQAARLQRVVQQTAIENGKRADILFSGADAELDRNVLERMTAPLEHLLRNAVVHGIEPPAERVGRNKAPNGEIRINLWREGTQLNVEVQDDGGGLDFDAIRATAIKRGLMPADAEIGDEQAAQFIFMPGFSTARTLTQDAGRGVGMDVVAAEVKQLGGTLELSSQPGRGARFLVRLPLNLALSQALLVDVGGESYAIPLSSIEGIVRIPRQELAAYYADGGPAFVYGGADYRVRSLAAFLGSVAAPASQDSKAAHAILVRLPEGIGAGDRRYAVVVDNLLGNREIVSKAVGAQVSSVPGVSGATILADGRAMLILDLAELAQDAARRALRTAVGGSEPVAPAVTTRGLIMVVDDSLTIRRVTERLLTRQGYTVVTAKDGLDAMAQLQTEAPLAILLDIEMPRADGFEVAAYVRNTTRIAKTPIIMITSRSGEKHRDRAQSLGVNRYLIKPYQDDQLLTELRGVLKES